MQLYIVCKKLGIIFDGQKTKGEEEENKTALRDDRSAIGDETNEVSKSNNDSTYMDNGWPDDRYTVYDGSSQI